MISTQGPLLGTYYSREVQVVASQLWALGLRVLLLLAPLVARNTLLIYILIMTHADSCSAGLCCA
jgi:hypothetical protein